MKKSRIDEFCKNLGYLVIITKVLQPVFKWLSRKAVDKLITLCEAYSEKYGIAVEPDEN